MRGCRKFARILGIEVSLSGHVPESGALVVSNHLGAFDPVILASQFPLAFAAKAELGRAPIVGWICRTVGIIFVERDRIMQAGSFADDVRARIDAGIRVLVFPEGTTSNGHSIRPFKTGSFEAVAEEAGYLVLPVCINVLEIDGEPATVTSAERLTWSDPSLSYGSHGWSVLGLRRVRVEVAVGEPIEAGSRDRKALAAAARAGVLSLKRLGPKSGETAEISA
jgi:1-acyl-sn-glycerol-3-phosphate acyltransferase